MIDSINEMFALDWTNQDGILEELSYDMAERLINNRMPFCIVYLGANNNICFEAITEYDSCELVLNMSERSGEVTDSMKGMKLEDIFYHDDFGKDGYLVYLDSDSEKSLFGQIMEEVDISHLNFFLCAEKEISEILKLKEGGCLVINCGVFMQKIQETSQDIQKRNADNRYR